MKIRSNYVSNSSSSSFIVLYKKETDFDNFKSFQGYSWLMENISFFKKKYVENSIECFLREQYHNYYNGVANTYSDENVEYTTSYDSTYIDLTIQLDIDDKEFIEKINDVLQASFEKSEKLEDFISLEDFLKQFDIKKLASELLKKIKKSGYQVGAFEIEDCETYDVGSDEKIGGYYLEHQFLPFVAKNPDGKNVLVYRDSHH